MLGESVMNIEKLIALTEKEQIIWRNHILERMRQRGISISHVLNCIKTGEIIEKYENDYPYPSALILGKTTENTFLHVVCAEGQNKIWMITAYCPDIEEWFEDFKTRR